MFLSKKELKVAESVITGQEDILDHPVLYNKLCEYYADEIPYGTLKARDGDPYEWITDRLAIELKPKDRVLLECGCHEALLH